MSKGEKGSCQFSDNGKIVSKTKFDTKENCQSKINSLLSISIVTNDTKPYKCKECKMWHMGKLADIEKYGI